jgi:hypothetical protein
MQPTRPAPMSGGTPSRPSPAEGDHPACTTSGRKGGDTAEDARSEAKGLVLTARGPQAPKKRGKKVSRRLAVSPRARDRSRMAETRQRRGSVHESPVRPSAGRAPPFLIYPVYGITRQAPFQRETGRAASANPYSAQRGSRSGIPWHGLWPRSSSAVPPPFPGWRCPSAGSGMMG